MLSRGGPVTIVVAEDEDEDYWLLSEAFREAGLRQKVVRVKNGQEVLEFLLGTGDHRGRVLESASSVLVLLDLNMPRMCGFETLKAMRSNPALRDVPVIVLSCSGSGSDVAQAYTLGANSYIRKPTLFDDLVTAVRAFDRYWLATARLPDAAGLHS